MFLINTLFFLLINLSLERLIVSKSLSIIRRVSEISAYFSNSKNIEFKFASN